MKCLNKRIGSSLVLFLFLFLFSFSFVIADINTPFVEDVFKVNEIIRYTKPCINNGTYCSTTSQCNFTFYNRDNSILINNQEGASVGNNSASLWEYNITRTETGLYKVDMCCEDGINIKGCETLYYQISGDGFNASLGFYVLIIAISFGIIILGFYLTDAWITMLGTFGLFGVGVYTMLFGIAGMKDLFIT